MFGILQIIIVCIISVNARTDCPQLQTPTFSWGDVAHEAKALLSFRKYNTSEIKYYVMTPSSYPGYVNNDGEKVNWKLLDCRNKQILFNCHGWDGSALQPIFIDIAKTFVEQYKGCVVSSDYSGASRRRNIIFAFSRSEDIAESMADYLTSNICEFTTDCTLNLQMHGHSWGAHTCGIAGYKLGQRGFKPYRLISSDAAGPYFNKLQPEDPTRHMTRESATTVINIKTSSFAGSGRPEWAHQTQYIGLCGSAQDQCRLKGKVSRDSCDHMLSMYYTKSTMNKNFPRIRLRKCEQCPYLTRYAVPSFGQCIWDLENLGWQSRGKAGIFVIKSLPVCLNLTLDTDLW